MNHCEGCMIQVRGGWEPTPECPGCPECARLQARLAVAERVIAICEEWRHRIGRTDLDVALAEWEKNG